MTNLLSFDFFLSIPYFLVSIFLAFYLPGHFFIKRLNLSQFQTTILAFIFGMVLWGWQGYLFGFLNVRWFSYIYVFTFLILWIRYQKISKLKIKVPKIKKWDFVLIALISSGVVIQALAVWFNGVSMNRGLLFCCGSIQDNVLFLAITDEISKRFPPYEPGMYGTYKQNYHYWGSLVIGELVRVFNLPLIATSYQFMTVFLSLFLGLSALVFAQILGVHKVFARWLIFFLFFGGDFVWLIIAMFRGNSFFAMSSMESGAQYLENMPRAFAVVVFFCGLSLFINWIKKKDYRFTGIFMALVFAACVGFKVYVGFFALIGLGFLGIYYFIKKEFHRLFPITLTFLLSAVVYFPVNTYAGGIYFIGLWRFENFIVQPWLNLDRLELARVVFANAGNKLRVIQYELIFALVFIFSTFGTKILGIFQNRKSLSLVPIELHIILIPAIIASFFLGAFFAQTSGGPNTFNFLVSVFIIGSIYTALACFYWLQGKGVVKILFVFLIIMLTVPRVLNQTIVHFDDISNGRGFTIGHEELSAINFLSRETQGIVLTDPKLRLDNLSPYLPFLTNQRMFLSGIVNELLAHNIDFSKELKTRDFIFNSNNAEEVGKLLRKNDIRYIYMYSGSRLKSEKEAAFLKKVFENGKIKILTLENN